MTILIATVAERFAIVSQDTFVYRRDSLMAEKCDFVDEPDRRGALEVSWETAAAANFTGDGTPPGDEAWAWSSKIVALPHLRAIVAGTGQLSPYMRYIANAFGALMARDVAELDRLTPNLLDHTCNAHPEDAGPLTVIAAGWLPREGRIAAFGYASADGFRSQPLTGHTIGPLVDDEAPGYGEIYKLQHEAQRDPETACEFHLLCAKNQHAAYRAGRYPKGACVGGELVTATLDGDGIRIVTRDVFEDPARGGDK